MREQSCCHTATPITALFAHKARPPPIATLFVREARLIQGSLNAAPRLGCKPVGCSHNWVSLCHGGGPEQSGVGPSPRGHSEVCTVTVVTQYTLPVAREARSPFFVVTLSEACCCLVFGWRWSWHVSFNIHSSWLATSQQSSQPGLQLHGQSQAPLPHMYLYQVLLPWG